MDIIAIDIGTYSVKFIESSADKRSAVHHHLGEVLIDEARKQFGDSLSLEELQIQIIKTYLQGVKKDVISIAQINQGILTTRKLVLPTKHKRKAEMMIPFQLEENIPYAIDQIQLASVLLEAEGDQTVAIVSLLPKEEFARIHAEFTKSHVTPHYFTSEIFLCLQYALDDRKEEAFCILDMGHENTKSYFFDGMKFISHNSSPIAGKHLDEVISKTYNISLREAQAFKHKNAFLLTSSQYHNASTEQAQFAKLMERTLSPFMDDFARWELGFRLQTGKTIEKVYLTGGTSALKNCEMFFSSYWNIPVLTLDTFDPMSLNRSTHDFDISKKTRFNNANLMVRNCASKIARTNFNNGDFADVHGEGIPIHSASFIGLRVLFITALVVLALFIENIVLSNKTKELHSRSKNILKNTILELPPTASKKFETKPKEILSTLNKKKKALIDKMLLIDKHSRVNAFDFLSRLSQSIDPKQMGMLLQYENSEGAISAIFEAFDKRSAEQFKISIATLGLKNISVKSLENPLQIEISYHEEI
ncbi:MAG: pilus assembly protein PilM [Bacteriovoracaceae bacterium]|nr:pilus assembly protein PilM [Bacteriovoracaceae bacterium]